MRCIIIIVGANILLHYFKYIYTSPLGSENILALLFWGVGEGVDETRLKVLTLVNNDTFCVFFFIYLK